MDNVIWYCFGVRPKSASMPSIFAFPMLALSM